MKIYEFENITSAFDRLADLVGYNKASCDISDLVDQVENYINELKEDLQYREDEEDRLKYELEFERDCRAADEEDDT